ncbi:serine/threonine-protein kinase pelle [Scaptodrosophila lebanonensis]|uniref:non-specific serine/threonine protein kinase n=1 Tax=Drosophila lebanonensis TaxID=7225 RepID=A0A6J2T4Q0_DROLE|nr:serine/threonine-protein kinase pelle [Scaptodrosophila lebanonensis]
MKTCMMSTGPIENSNGASGTRSRSGRERDTSILIRNLPVPDRQRLCQHLDSLDVWLQLAQFVKLHPEDVEKIRHKMRLGFSPSDEFLTVWGGQYDHSAYNLFALFQKMSLHHAMRLIMDHVDEKYHKYIPKSMPTISELRRPATNSKINNGPPFASSSGVSNSNNNSMTSVSNSSTQQGLESKQSEILDSMADIGASAVQHVAKSSLEIDYQELVCATNNFSPSNKLGHGGFGDVYKGYWKQINVAIKVMNYRQKNNQVNGQIELRQSYTELKYLSTIRYDNILALYGFSINGDKPCLVYELMIGGSLESRLKWYRAKPQPLIPLTWAERFRISLGTAKGIYFLHTARTTPLIHGDIKPANILLDKCGLPKIGDFGLAREGPKSLNATMKVKHVFGTRFYLPPEFLESNKLSTGVDIYSFGIVLMEVFTGRFVMEHGIENSQKNSLMYVNEIRSQFQGNRLHLFDNRITAPVGDDLERATCAINVGLQCTATNPQERPSMDEVVKRLKVYCDDF